jgi:hypothetical protein
MRSSSQPFSSSSQLTDIRTACYRKLRFVNDETAARRVCTAACASISESPDGGTAKARGTQVPPLWHRNSLFPQMDSRRSRCTGPPSLRGFVVTLPMIYLRLRKQPRPPRTSSSERYPECARSSLFSRSEPCFQPVNNAEARSPSLPVGPFSPLGLVSAHYQKRSMPLC